jgi:SNF2 family DNA or RNA helicase
MTSKSATTKNKVSRLCGLAWKPLPYMRRAVKFLLEHGGAALFLDPGLGKTSITLAALKILLKEGVVERVVIVAPLRVIYSVWPNEIQKWNDFQHITFSICHGAEKETAIRQNAQIYLVNPEGLEWFLSNWKLVKPDTLVVDESTKFKNSQSKRFKILRPMLGKFKRRWILTGTPAPNGLLDLFSQMYIVDEGRSLGRYITHYRNEYFDACGFGGYDWRIRKGADVLVYKKIKPYALRLQAEDFIDLPDMVENDVYVDLPTKAFETYFKVELTAFAELEDGAELNPASAAAAVSKCRQISNGAVYATLRDSLSKAVNVHDAKMEALESILEERGGKPVMVAYEFVHDYSHACEYFRQTFPFIGGGVSPKRADELVRAWNAGELPVLFVHPQSAGHGLNMQENEESDCIIWMSPPWDLELYDQLNRRLRRSGAKFNRLFVHRLIGRSTVDEIAAAVLRGKNRTQKKLLDYLKTYRKSHKRNAK